jgi:pyruvate dehydrogenase E2 component (dihydrolipoamide acetyltransferase)
MGRIIDMPLPRLGETMEEGRIIAWLKQPGESFRRGETLLEVETDKTVVECPALTDGKLVEHLVRVEERVPVDRPIARIEVEGGATVEPASSLSPAAQEHQAAATSSSRRPVPHQATGRVRASGKARALARASGVDLAKLKGSGRRGRIGAEDVASSVQKVEKPRVILIHGLFADGASFSLLKLMLERLGHQVIAVDLPLHGANPEPAGTIADAIASVVKQLPDGELVLLGHSLGAIVASGIAAQNTRRIRRLVLLSPAGFGIDINTGFINAMLEARTEDQLIDALQMLGPAKVSRSFASEQLRRIAAHREELSAFIATVAANGLQKVAILEEIAKLSVPVTAVFSRDDPILPLHHALAAPRNVELRIVSGCGHVPHWYQAEFIASLVTS